MEAVMTWFNEYDLSELWQEYRNTLCKNDQDVILPEKIGGSKVHLLIGIKNANLTPILDRILESGVAVYTSPFKDILFQTYQVILGYMEFLSLPS